MRIATAPHPSSFIPHPSLVSCREYDAHYFIGRGNSFQYLLKAILLQLQHPVRLGGIADIVQWRPADNQLGDFVIHAHQRVYSEPALVACMPADLAPFAAPQSDFLVRRFGLEA